MKATTFLTATIVLFLASAAQAQIVVYSAPVTRYYAPTFAAVPVQTVVRPRRAVTTYYSPTAIAIPATTVYYTPFVTTSRTTTYYSSVSSMPVATVAYREPVLMAAPVVTYSPVMTYSPVIVGRPVVVGRGIVGQPKIYVGGQPIRNTVRFVTP